MRNYLKVVSDSENWSESKKKLYRPLSFIRALGYNIEDYATVEMDYEFMDNTYDFGIHAENLELLVNIDKGNTVVPKDEYINNKPLVVLSVMGKNVQIAFRLIGIKDVVDLYKDEDALVFVTNSCEGKETLKSMLASITRDNEIFNEFIRDITNGILSDKVIDAINIENKDTFREKFKAEMQKFTQNKVGGITQIKENVQEEKEVEKEIVQEVVGVKEAPKERVNPKVNKDFFRKEKPAVVNTTEDPFADADTINISDRMQEFADEADEPYEVILDSAEDEDDYTSEFEGEPPVDEDDEDLLGSDEDDVEPVFPGHKIVKEPNNIRIPSINKFDDDPFA